ncbi:PadR family transcriptional regulator [Streptomyces sp. NPDC094472]|uniref:PadR family transcriptional regulator n=1 Tax=Streptomyces sp. NPDC094472 TaxID=3155080 RepID=UPI003328D26D
MTGSASHSHNAAWPTSYDLKRAISRSVGYFWNFPHAQLYSEPKRLQETGLLELHQEGTGRRRKTYTITAARRDHPQDHERGC